MRPICELGANGRSSDDTSPRRPATCGRSSTSTVKWITALDLSRWADTTGARTALSEPVSALIRAAASDIRSFRFLAGDAAQIPDYDERRSPRVVAPYIPRGGSAGAVGVVDDEY